MIDTTPDADDVAARRATFDEFYADHWAPALRTAYVMTGERAVAEDICQDAFVGLARAWDGVEHPAAYLRRSIVNRVINAGTRTRRHDPVLPDLASAAGEPVLDEAWALLAGLPARQRAALALRFYDDLPEAEIARLLGCRPGTVKSLIHRGLAALRPLMEDHR